jgi:hypothetical protein
MQHSLTLYRIDPARNMHRFYRLDIQPDLFGNQCLIREWGRIGRLGQMRSTPSLPRMTHRLPSTSSGQRKSAEDMLHNVMWRQWSYSSAPVFHRLI